MYDSLIIEAMAGIIILPDTGTETRCRLDCSPTRRVKPGAAGVSLSPSFLGEHSVNFAATDPPDPTPLAILVVDDDPSVSAFVRAALVGMGHRVTSVSNCASALDKLNDYGHAIDAIILDLQLPDGDGRSVADVALTRRPVPTVVFVSGCRDAIAQVAGSHPNSTALSKPFDVAELESALPKLSASDGLVLNG